MAASPVTLVHKGNIQSSPNAPSALGLTSGSQEFRDHTVTERESWILGKLEATPA